MTDGHDSHAQLDHVLKTMTDGFQIIDHDWRFTYMNDAAKRMLREQGRHPEALIGQRVFDDAFPEAKDSPPFRYLQRVMHERVPVEFEHLYEPSKRWYHVRAYPVQDNGIAVFFYDMTERKQADAHVHTLLEAAPDATVAMGLDGRMLRVDRQTERLALRKDGTAVAVDISLSPIETKDGMHVSASVRDIADQHRTTQELARLAAIVQWSDDPIISKNQAGIITSWNQGAEQLFGYTAEEAIGQPIMMLIPPSHEAEERHIMANVLNGAVTHCETIRCRKDRRRVDVSLTVSPIRDERGAPVGAATIARDITAQKQAQTALCESEARMASEAAALARLNELSSRLWHTAGLREGLDEMLTATIELLGADMGDLQLVNDRGVLTSAAHIGLGHDFLEFFREASTEDDSACGRALQSGKRIVIEDVETDVSYARMRDSARAAGYRAVQSAPLIARDGRRLGLLSTLWRSPHRSSDLELHRLDLYIRQAADFIERHHADRVVRESEGRLRMAMTGGHMGAWDIELETGALLWDAKQHELFGQPLDQTPRTVDDFYALLHPDDVDRIQKAGVVARLTGTFSEEFRILRPDGQIRWLMGQGAILHDAAGQPFRMVGVNYDITEKKQAQCQLESFTEALERRVTARTVELLDSQAHLRALAAELNVAEQRERKRLAGELHDHLQQLLVLGRMTIKQGRHLTVDIPALEQLLNKLDDVLSAALTYSRTLVAELSPPVLGDYGLGAGLKWIGEYMKKYDLVVTVTVPDEAVRLPEDQALLLFQSVRELLINAAKHAGTGQVDVALEVRNGYLQIRVHDEGAGCDSTTAVAVAPDSPAGGLSSKFGLFSIRERMLALGGSFDLQSAPGKGTTARLLLPLDSRSDRRSGERNL